MRGVTSLQRCSQCIIQPHPTSELSSLKDDHRELTYICWRIYQSKAKMKAIYEFTKVSHKWKTKLQHTSRKESNSTKGHAEIQRNCGTTVSHKIKSLIKFWRDTKSFTGLNIYPFMVWLIILLQNDIMQWPYSNSKTQPLRASTSYIKKSTKSSLADDTGIRHGFVAKTSLPITQQYVTPPPEFMSFGHIVEMLNQTAASS